MPAVVLGLVDTVRGKRVTIPATTTSTQNVSLQTTRTSTTSSSNPVRDVEELTTGPAEPESPADSQFLISTTPEGYTMISFAEEAENP